MNAVGVRLDGGQVAVCNADPEHRYVAEEWNAAGGHPREVADACRCNAGFHVEEPRRKRDASPTVRWGDAGKRFTALPNVLIEHRDALRLTANDLAVILALESVYCGRHEFVGVHIPELVRRSGLSREGIKRTLKGLARRGLVVIAPGKGRPGFGTPNAYSTKPLRTVAQALAAALPCDGDIAEIMLPLLTELEVQAMRREMDL